MNTKYKYLVTDHIMHITADDTESIGCALVVDYYNKLLINSINKIGYIPIHHFNTIKDSGKLLKFFIDYMNSIFYGLDIDIPDKKLVNKFKRITTGDNYPDHGVLCIPRYIIITNLFIESKILDKLNDIVTKFNIKIIYVDHHTSSYRNICRYPWCYISKSAYKSSLPIGSSKYFLSIIDNLDIANELLPDISNLAFLNNYIHGISLYTAWSGHNNTNMYVTEDYTNILIQSFGNTNVVYNILHHEIFNDNNIKFSLYDIPYFKGIIDKEKRSRDLYIKNHMKYILYTDIKKLNLPLNNFDDMYAAVVLLPEKYINEIMENAYRNRQNVDIVIGINPDTRRLIFRCFNNNDDVDVSKIANAYNGSGTKTIAGANLTIDQFISFLETYYKLIDD